MKQKTSEIKRTGNSTCVPTEAPKQTAPARFIPLQFTGGLPALPPNAMLPIPQAESSSHIASTSSTPAALDRFVQIKIDSLREKQRADSFFNSLPPEQRNKLAEWIIADDKNVIELWRRVTKPVPEGLGIQVSLKT